MSITDENYSQLRNIISEEDMAKCRDFIYKIKEHRYFKVKRRQIDKFKHLLHKSFQSDLMKSTVVDES